MSNSKSKYVQINNWSLLEYSYSKDNTIQDNNLQRIENKITDTYQFLNSNEFTGISKTNNVLDRNSMPINKLRKKWAYLDIDTPVSNLDVYKNDIIRTSGITSPNLLTMQYDTIKLHIVSGFNFDEGVNGVILNTQLTEEDGTKLDLSNYTFLKGDTQFEYNSNPLFIGNKLYDKFIQIKIPSLEWITNNSSTLGVTGNFIENFTHNKRGFKQNSLIDITLYEINRVDIKNHNRTFITDNKYSISVTAADYYGLLGTKLQESKKGDYYEYYPTWDDGFIGTYLSNLNNSNNVNTGSGGGNWVIVNEINVYELIGTTQYRTFNFTSFQDDNFDTPNLFRPIILNSNIAHSFRIEYTMRLLNQDTGEQIIRKSTTSSRKTKKYGKTFERINVAEGFSPIKVYNKITSMDSDAPILSTNAGDITPALFSESIKTKYITNYYNNYNIGISTDNLDNSELDKTIFGQGNAYILINEFDNFIKFNIHTKNANNDEYERMDLSVYDEIKFVVIKDGGNKKYINALSDENINESEGEILFKLDSDFANSILNSTTKKFYLVSKNNKGEETVIYQGNYENFKNRDKVIEITQREKEIELKKRIEEFEKLEEELEKRRNELIELEEDLQERTGELEREHSIRMNELEDQNRKKIINELNRIRKMDEEKEAKRLENAKKRLEIVYKEIPGVNENLTATPVSAIKPLLD